MLPDFLTDPAWLTAILAVAMPFVGFSGRVLWKRWQERKETRAAERKVIYDLLRYLENRRALYTHWADETPRWVIMSVRHIRDRLMVDIEKLGEASEDLPALQKMQVSCRRFLTLAESMSHLEQYDFPPHDEWLDAFLDALKSLRETFDTHMSNLWQKYGIEEGPTPEDENPFIGKRIRTIYVAPPHPPQRKPKNDED